MGWWWEYGFVRRIFFIIQYVIYLLLITHSIMLRYQTTRRKRSTRNQARKLCKGRYVRRRPTRRHTQRRTTQRKGATARGGCKGFRRYAVNAVANNHISRVYKTKGGTNFATKLLPIETVFYNGNMGMPRVGLGQEFVRHPFEKRVDYVKSLIQKTPKFFTCDRDLAQWYARSTAKTALQPVAETFVLKLKLQKACNMIDIYAEENHEKIRKMLRPKTLTKFNMSIASIATKGYRTSVYEDDYQISQDLCTTLAETPEPIDGFCCELSGHIEYMFCNPLACFSQVTNSDVQTISSWQKGETIATKKYGICIISEVRLMDASHKTEYRCIIPERVVKLPNGVVVKLANQPDVRLSEDDIANYHLSADGQGVLAVSPTICETPDVRNACGGATPLTPEQLDLWNRLELIRPHASRDEQMSELNEVI